MTCCLKTCLCLSLSLFPCWPTWCWSSPSWPTWMLAGTDTTPCHRAAPGPPPCDTWTSPGRHSQPSPPVYPKLWRYKSGSSSSNPDRPDTIKQKTLTDNPLLPRSLSCTGVGSEQQWSQKLISGPACLERNPPLWEQASEASLWIAVPQSANTHNTGKNELIITFHPLILFVPRCDPSRSSTVKHLEHVQPFRPPVVPATPEPPGRSEQICLLLWLCWLLPVSHERKWRRAFDRRRGDVHLRLSSLPAGGRTGSSPPLHCWMPPGFVCVCELWGGAVCRHPAECPVVAPPCDLVPQDDMGLAECQA